MALVPTVRTVCTNYELCKAIIVCWKQLFGAIPSKKSVCVLQAQHQLETGGNDSWNFNICNIKYVTSAGNVDFCALKGVWEIVNGKKVILSETDPGSWFRSFPTLNDGVTFYLNFINGKRYRVAWPAIVAGDPKQFCVLLKQQGYYTASVEDYSRAVIAYFNKFMKETSYETVMSELKEAESTIQVPAEPPLVLQNKDSEIPNPTSDVASQIGFWQSVLNFLLNIFKK